MFDDASLVYVRDDYPEVVRSESDAPVRLPGQKVGVRHPIFVNGCTQVLHHPTSSSVLHLVTLEDLSVREVALPGIDVSRLQPSPSTKQVVVYGSTPDATGKGFVLDVDTLEFRPLKLMPSGRLAFSEDEKVLRVRTGRRGQFDAYVNLVTGKRVKRKDAEALVYVEGPGKLTSANGSVLHLDHVGLSITADGKGLQIEGGDDAIPRMAFASEVFHLAPHEDGVRFVGILERTGDVVLEQVDLNRFARVHRERELEQKRREAERRAYLARAIANSRSSPARPASSGPIGGTTSDGQSRYGLLGAAADAAFEVSDTSKEMVIRSRRNDEFTTDGWEGAFPTFTVGYWGVMVVVFPDETESVTVRKGGQVVPMSGPVQAGRAVVYMSTRGWSVPQGVKHQDRVEYTVRRKPGVTNAAAELILFKQPN